MNKMSMSCCDVMTVRTEAKINWDMLEPVVKIVILLASIIVIIFAFQQNVLFTKSNLELGHLENIVFSSLFLISMLIFISSLIFRTLLWFRYRPFDSGQVVTWPEVTVVVPAYNEGEAVFQTIRSIARSDYPPEKLKIITVDDGSRDDTYSHMVAAQKRYPHMVEIINFPANRGKRQAIYEAYRRATAAASPYLVTIDSDTILESSALKEILTPLILNQKIAAVTGRIKVWNKEANMLTRMLNAHFAMAFDFTRAIQSTFRCVFCLAGAFSAYRVNVLHQVMDAWLRQRFLKIPCTYGEDRSLTNHILREGHGSFFQRTAVSFTIVPEGLTRILKMLTRWARSNIRESIIFSRLVFNSKRKGNILLPFIDFFMTISLMILHFMWFYYFLFSNLITANFFLRIISYSILFGFLYALYYIRIEGKKDSPYILIFSIFSSIFMIWIFTAAGLTLTKKSWSTR